MQLELLPAFDENTHLERRRHRRTRHAPPSNSIASSRSRIGRDGEGRQTCLHFVVECFEDLFGEEAIERLG